MPFYNISIVVTVTMTQIYFSEILQQMFIPIYLKESGGMCISLPTL